MNIPVSLNLSAFSRFPLLEGPTPIQHLTRLSRQLGGVDVFVKRDDLNGLGGGGNKLRKLEFLIGAALAEGADTIITMGGRQSNHARLTAAAAARAGLKCELVLAEMAPRYDRDYIENGNVLLDELFGARIHNLAEPAGAVAFIEERAASLGAEGRKAYISLLGGSSPTGCLGYARCAAEIAEQTAALDLAFDEIIIPNGSGGTHAGLVAGFAAIGGPRPSITAFTVLGQAEPVRLKTLDIADRAVKLIDPALAITGEEIRIDGTQLGEGYGIPTAEMLGAVRLLASTEGLLLDPVYSGKAFAGLLHSIEAGKYRAGQKLLFIMTGGVPGLFAYRSAFQTVGAE